MGKEKYKYSICMTCKHFDIYENDNAGYECKCDKGKKLIIPRVKEQSCSDYKKVHNKLPWWYLQVCGFEDMKPFVANLTLHFIV